MNPQEFKEWKEEKTKIMTEPIGSAMWQTGADAAYSLLSKEIEEKDEQLKQWRSLYIINSTKLKGLQKK